MKNAGNKEMLIPKRRFPKFRNGPGWEEIRFREVVARSFYGTSQPTADDGQYPVLRMGNMSDGQVDFSNLAYINLDEADFRQMCLLRGDILLNRTNSHELVGKISLFDSSMECLTASYIVAYRLKIGRINPGFCNYLLNTGHWQRRIKVFATIGVSQSNINPTVFQDSLTICLPEMDEQDRIAACLRSIDELIGAECQKLDALKAHKKGLMQQLFPSEDETIPRLRFPEFRKAKAWRKRKISEVLTKTSIPVQVEPERTYREIGIRSHGKGVFHKERVSGAVIADKRVFQVVEDALVLNIVFAWERAVATTSKDESGMIASHRFPMYVPKSESCDVRFMKHALLTPQGKNLLGIASPGGAGRNRTLGQDIFEDSGIIIPDKEEQAKIADCIRSVDDLITAQTAKLESVKSHKRGLTQQLFPPAMEAGV
jgi:type I restriction enzyme S subunit